MNSDGFENPTEKFVMRAVPHTLSLATSITSPNNRAPVQRTGWSGDAAPGSGALRLLPGAAVEQHFTLSLNRVEGRDFVLPTDSQLDRLEAFLLASGRLADLNLHDVTMTDARRGKSSVLMPAKEAAAERRPRAGNRNRRARRREDPLLLARDGGSGFGDRDHHHGSVISSRTAACSWRKMTSMVFTPAA